MCIDFIRGDQNCDIYIPPEDKYQFTRAISKHVFKVTLAWAESTERQEDAQALRHKPCFTSSLEHFWKISIVEGKLGLGYMVEDSHNGSSVVQTYNPQ